MRYLFTFLLFFFIFQSTAQVSDKTREFRALISKGDELYVDKNYKASAEAYEKALAMQKGTASQHYNTACSWALAGDQDKAIQHLQQAAHVGWKNLDHLKSDKDLSGLYEHEQWDEIVEAVRANKREYEKDLNIPLKEQLEAIYIRDQTLRHMLDDVTEKFGQESDELKYYWKLISREDSINEAEVDQIITKYGWVGKSEVGGKANMTLWLVVQHAPVETQEKYLPLLQESVKKGESQGSHLALLEDRIQMRNGKPQTYGSQIITHHETGEMVVYDLKDPEFVDQRRAEVGLGPLKDYAKRLGAEFNVKQKQR